MKEAAIKQIWTCVRLVAVDTVSIAEGRGLHGGNHSSSAASSSSSHTPLRRLRLHPSQ